jgi:hypothetical protein
MSDEFVRTARRCLLSIEGEMGEATINPEGEITAIPRYSAEKLADVQSIAQTKDEVALTKLLADRLRQQAVNNSWKVKRERDRAHLYQSLVGLKAMQDRLEERGIKVPKINGLDEAIAQGDSPPASPKPKSTEPTVEEKCSGLIAADLDERRVKPSDECWVPDAAFLRQYAR